MADRPKWLIFGIGNPSRGDDALGSSFVERLSQWLERPGHQRSLSMDLVVHTDFQCQIEHALDLVGVSRALFIDASHTAKAPFELTPLAADFDATHTTHALSPACVLAVAERLGQTLPDCWLLAIPGHDFELGADLSALSRTYLDQAFDWVLRSIRQGSSFLATGNELC